MRWHGYAAGTEADHFAWWCENYLVQSVDQFAGLPLILEPWQREFMGEALAVDDAGIQCWRSVALVVARKNGKTALLAAYALWRLLNDDGQPEILLAAASDKQAGRLFDQAVSFVRANQELNDQLHLREYIGEIARSDGGGKVLRVASDPNTLHGYNPSLVICDELHAWQKPSQRKAWSALTTAGGARSRTQVFTITTAGDAETRETSILGRMIDTNEKAGALEKQPGLTISRNQAAQTIIYDYCAPTTDPTETAKMKLANPASWITEDYLATQAVNPELAPSEVLQLHGCVWAASINAWVTVEQWEACYEADASIPKEATTYLGADIALVHDSSAVARAWKRDDGKVVVECDVWTAKANGLGTFVDGGVIKLDLVEDHIRSDMAAYDVAEFVYDPRFFERSAEMLAEEGLLTAPVPQASSQMADAYEAFYAAVLEGRVVHAGDRVLTAHVMATAAQKTDRGWKISKLRSSQRIDALVAVVIAHWRAALSIDAPPWALKW